MKLAGLRIAVVGPLPPPSGGMANQTRQLAELLAGAGAQVDVIQVNKPYWPACVGRLPVIRAMFRLAPYLWKLWLVAGRVDIMHVMANSGWSWHLFAAPAIWVGYLRGCPVVVNYRGGEAAAFLQRSAAVTKASIRRACALVVPSGFLQNVFGCFGIQAEILPNIVDLDRFHPRIRNAPAERPVLLVARNLEPLYDNLTAIRAFEMVLADHPMAQLVIAGSGPLEQELRDFVLQRGLAIKVRFSGRLDRDSMAKQYREADLVVNPSLADNMPNSLLEAWASGVPVVTTNVGGIPYLARDGSTASLVPPRDPIAMARACTELLSDAKLWHERVEAGLVEARRYTWASVQPVLLNVYARALQHVAR